MSIVAWIILGLVAGYIASTLVDNRGKGPLLDIGLGVVGAVLGGFLFNQLGAAGVTGFNLYSMGVAIVGASVLLLVYHAIAGRRAATWRAPPPVSALLRARSRAFKAIAEPLRWGGPPRGHGRCKCRSRARAR